MLQEALTNEDDARHAPTVDELGPEAAALLEELRERQQITAADATHQPPSVVLAGALSPPHIYINKP